MAEVVCTECRQYEKDCVCNHLEEAESLANKALYYKSLREQLAGHLMQRLLEKKG